MANRCEICGKGPVAGNNVSHSKVHTRTVLCPTW
jgi:large subunit ribosomal protein L28